MSLNVGLKTRLSKYGIIFLIIIMLLPSQVIQQTEVVALENEQLIQEEDETFRIVGYFPSWGIYDRDYRMEDIDGNKVTHINYAFADICWGGIHGNPSQDPGNPNQQTWSCTDSGVPLQSGNVPDGSIVLGEPWADVQTTYGGEMTGVTFEECMSEAKCGNFKQMRDLKDKYPHVKTLISVGGWTWSNRFSDMAADPVTRQRFAESSVDFIREYGFDGVDLDWEYPVVEAIPGNSARPEDKTNFTLLLQDIRDALDEAGVEDGQHYLLTIASGANPVYAENTELDKIANIVDFINIMTYDYHGGSWEANTSFNSPLYPDPNDPYYDDPNEATYGFYIDYGVQLYKQHGVPMDKLVLGMPIYARSWKNCNTDNYGLFQECTESADGLRVPVGTWDSQQWGFTGVFDYGDIAADFVNQNGYVRYWNDYAKVPYLFNADLGVFISYDDEESIGYKTEYVRQQGLGGAMFWEFSGDCRTSSKYNCTGTKMVDVIAEELYGKPIPSQADNEAPSAPENVVVLSKTHNSITLSWNAATDNIGVVGYDVYNGSTFAGSVTGTNIEITRLIEETSYTFTIKAKDENSNVSTFSNPISVTTNPRPEDLEPPTIPTNLIVTGKTQNSVYLAWESSTDDVELTHYVISNGLNSIEVNEIETSIEFTGLVDNTTYTFTVKAKDAVGKLSDESNAVIVTTDPAPVFPEWEVNTIYTVGDKVTYNGKLFECISDHTSLDGWQPGNVPTLWTEIDPTDTQSPTPPTNLVVTDVSENSVSLSWSASSDNMGVTAYDVLKGSELVATVTDTNATILDLNPNQTYTFTVKAKDAAGNFSMTSDIVSVKTDTGDLEAPTSPMNLTVTAVTDKSVSLSWDASMDNVGIAGYNIYINNNDLVQSVSSTNATVQGLIPDTSYTFTVMAKDMAGNVSDPSNAVNVTTDEEMIDAEAPSIPSNLMATNITDTSITLEWNASTDNVGVTGYDIYNGASMAANVIGTTATISSLMPNNTYTFSVKARDVVGNVSMSSNELQVSTTDTPSVRDKIIVGYWHNFDNGSGFIRLSDISPDFDVINVAFAEPTNGAQDGTIGFTPYNYTDSDFIDDVAYLQSQGKKIIISIGGANGQVQLATDQARDNFISSMKDIISTYGFNGLDIDFEGQSLHLDPGDTDINNPTTPVVSNLISAVRELHDYFGDSFMITMAPETFFVQLGYTFYGGSGGSDDRAGVYLPVIQGLRDILDWLQVQHYNSGPIPGLDNVYYNMGNADFHVAMAEMVLTGFPVAGNTDNYFLALRPDQVLIGLPANVNAGNGFTSVSEVHKALDYLMKGESFGGQYTLQNPEGFPGMRGLMTWSINWDQFNNFEFSSSHRAYLDSFVVEEDTEAPSTPSNLMTTNITSTSVTLAWNASTDNVGVTEYTVNYGSGSMDVTDTSTTVTGLSENTSYTFTVTAKDAVGNVSSSSNAVTVTTDGPDTETPTAPTNLQVTDKSSSSVSLSWNASTDNVGVTGYTVDYGSGSMDVTDTNTTISGLSADTTYTFTVTAKDAAGNMSQGTSIQATTDASMGAQSWEVGVSYQVGDLVTYGGQTYVCITAHTSLANWQPPYVPALWSLDDTVEQDTQAPTIPGNLQSTSKTSNSVSLVWDASTDNVGVTGYTVNYGSGSMNVTSTSTTINGLSADTTYTFTVTAKDAAGNESSSSNAITVTTDISDPTDEIAPSTPTNLQVTGQSTSSISLSWSASTDNVGVTGYTVSYGSGSMDVTGTSATISGLSANTSYTFTVTAKDAAGNVSSGTDIEATTDASTGTQPWEAGISYNVNDEVTYGGQTYVCIQSHTSLAGWEPPNVPALWGLK
ncbi:fibronectin type III domain-containing protein [Chengkuizengella sediminis]|uniref:fibronectin type III domain-containing protein n=1 Tax=Chengkuizengella sediminis TaxID=1885917 RepID=UPI00138A23FE|nr:glycosyl hydrolase family 18 protein [Chengkuizengella sediminis]NDI35828.1 hypothetical protein [Chengkuizengella sediminis]